MPFKSKAQQRWMFAAEARGELPKGTAREWADHTPNIKDLPERIKKKKRKKAMFTKGFKKTAGIDWPKQEPESVRRQKGRIARGEFKKSLPGDTYKKVKHDTFSDSISEARTKMHGLPPGAGQRNPLKKGGLSLLRGKKAPASAAGAGAASIGLAALNFTKGLKKVAEASMSMEANQQSGWSIGDEMPGTELRNNAETGQFKGKSYRTPGVQNEGREMNPKLKQKAQTARGGNHYGGTIR